MSSGALPLSHTLVRNSRIPQRHPLLILHGLFGLSRNWRSIGRSLARRHSPIVCADLRNHGDSPHSWRAGVDSMSEDVCRLIETELGQEFQDKRVHLMGHSLGGRVAMLTALSRPDLVKSLVIVDCGPRGSGGNAAWFRSIMELLLSLDLSRPPYASLGRTKAEYDAFLMAEVKSKPVREFLLSNLAEDPASAGRFRWRCNLRALLASLDELLGFSLADCRSRFDGPTLFIGGGESEYVKPDDQLILQLFPSAKIQFIAGAGHWVHSDKPKEFCQLVTEFLTKVQ